MANPAPTINQINAFNATQGTTIDFNIIGGTELVRSNKIYIYDLSDNSLICTHLYVSTESIHELPPNTDGSIVYESGKSSADFVNGAQYYAQIQTFTDIAGTQGGSGLSVSKLFWCLVDPSLTIATIPSSISTTSYNVSATYDANTSVVSNIIQQYQFNLYSATSSLLQSSGVVVGNGEQQGTSTAYDISYNFSGLSVGSSYYVVVDVTTTQGMSISAQSSTFTVSIDTPTLGEATVVNNACDGYISVTSNLSSEYGGSASGEIATFETDSVNNVTKLEVTLEPTQEGTGDPSPSNVRPIVGHSSVAVEIDNGEDTIEVGQDFNVTLTPTVIDETPYLFKQTGDVRGDRESLELVGGTVNWNQLVDKTASSSSGVTNNGDGSFTISSGATEYYILNECDIIQGHKYLAVCKNGNNNNCYFRIDGTDGNPWVSVGDGVGIFVAGFNATAKRLMIRAYNTTQRYTVTPHFTDLTAFFANDPSIADYVYSLETANAGAGIAWLRRYFPDLFAYSPYNTGTLESVKPTAHVTRGVNQWDEETVNGYFGVDGSWNGNTGNLSSKNPIPVLPNTTYYFNVPSTGYLTYWTKAVPSGVSNTEDFISRSGSFVAGSTFTTPSDCHAVHFNMAGSYGTTYKNDICINISNASINGKYFPYESHTSPISELELRGIPKLVDGELRFDGDTRKADGSNNVNRKYILVDFGTLWWGKSGAVFYSASLSTVIKKGSATGGYDHIICEKYIAQNAASSSSLTNKCISIDVSGNIQLRDNDYESSTGQEFKTAMNGVYAVIELATPTTETADPFTDPQEVSSYGTEEFVSSNGVPVGNKTTYKTRDIFGGTIDLASGVLTVDIVGIDMGEMVWNYDAPIFYSSSLISTIKEPSITVSEILLLSPIYKAVWASNLSRTVAKQQFANYDIGITNSGANKNIVVRNDSYTDATAFKSAMSGKILYYTLATPLTYQLTPHEIETLIGTNNVWSNAGDVLIEFHIPITNLLVKRQDVDDVSGNWLTLYSQPVEQASDMDFTFIDFLNQYGKKYKYALVPLLTQTQSGVEVEVEGGYTVSDEVQSIFDGVYIGDSTGVQRLKAGVAYNNLNTNQQVGVIPTLGNKYPIIVSNSNIQYDTGSVSGLIVPDDFYSDGNLSRLDMSSKREAINDFLTNKKPKILKDWNGNIWLVVFTDNVDVSFDNNYGMGVATFTSGWTEVGDPTNQEDLQRTGLINVGGD